MGELHAIFEGSLRGISKQPDPRKWLLTYLEGYPDSYVEHNAGGPRATTAEDRAWAEKDGDGLLTEMRAASAALQRAIDAGTDDCPEAAWLARYLGGGGDAAPAGCADGPLGDIEEITAKVACRGPIEAECVSGQDYYWCSCGRSVNQPWCDGTHRALNATYGTSFFPKKFTPATTGEYLFCGCRRSADPILCDMSHLDLPQDGPGRQVGELKFVTFAVTNSVPHTHDSVKITVAPAGPGILADFLKSSPAIEPAYHFALRVPGSLKTKPYTPLAYDPHSATIDFLIKKVDGGAVSPALHGLSPGDKLEVKGPCPGEFDVADAPANSHVLLIGAGSGLTPLYQLIFHQTAGAKNLSLHLLYGSKTVDDIWCEDALEQAVAGPSPLTSVAHFVSRGAVDTQKQGKSLYNAGRVDHGAIRKVVNAVGKPWKALLCGPPKFNAEVAKACRACGMAKEDVIVC